MEQSEIDSCDWFRMPAPFSFTGARPFKTVRPAILFVPDPKSNTRQVPPPLTVNRPRPGPMIPRLSEMTGSVAARNIVPVTFEKIIVSGPGCKFASMMACRSEPGPESAFVVTLKVPAATLASESASKTQAQSARAGPVAVIFLSSSESRKRIGILSG